MADLRRYSSNTSNSCNTSYVDNDCIAVVNDKFRREVGGVVLLLVVVVLISVSSSGLLSIIRRRRDVLSNNSQSCFEEAVDIAPAG